MKWSEQAWDHAEDVYQKILELDFLRELMCGSLEKDKFLFYIGQDSLYLAEFGKVLAGIAAKLNDAQYRTSFLKFADDTVSVEQALHQGFKEQLGDFEDVSPSPSCLLYTSYLHSTLANNEIAVAAAGVLPCFWVYKKVGDYILANQNSANNPYQSWINTYGGEDFAKAVEEAIRICDELAEKASEETRTRMLEAFRYATKMEWMFWESAYRKESFPV